MMKTENHILQVEIPYSLFAQLKMMSLNGRYKGVKELVKPFTDQLVSDLVKFATQQESTNLISSESQKQEEPLVQVI